MEYSKKQLADLAKGCFKNSNEPAFYANINGTFYNANQKAKLSKEDQEKLIEFKNPEFAEPVEEETEEQKAETEAKAKAKEESDAKKAAEKEQKEKAAAEAKTKKESEAAAKKSDKPGK
jgi:mRNA degradation ribonuclease J1/J2